MRFACSNIAWQDEEEDVALETLRRHGVTGLEVAPTRLWPDWHGASEASAHDFARRYADAGFEVPSMQSLLFARPEAQLFGPDGGRRFEAHLGGVARLGAALGAHVAVLGAPKNRARGGLPADRAFDLALPILRRLAGVYQDCGLVLAIEPARPEYGGDFLCTTREVIDAVRTIDRPGIAVHLDAAALHSAGESLAGLLESAPDVRFAHYQISEPGLTGFESPQAPQVGNLECLRRFGYEGWCSIEMLRQPRPLEGSGPWQILRAIASTFDTDRCVDAGEIPAG